MIKLEIVIEEVKKLLYEVGELQKEWLGKKDLKTYHKTSADDLVTEVDELSEKYLLEAIGSFYPGHGFLSEESGASNSEAEYLWIIDPLDGTTNFAQGIPIFAVSVALQFRGETVLGAIYQPLLGEMFTALKGRGAWLNGQRIEVSAKSDLAKSILATGFPYDKATHRENNAAYFAYFVPRVRGLRRLGAAAYDLACVAAGRFDGFWELNLSPWDVAAGILLVAEAGGKVEFLQKRGISLVAGNKVICDKVMEAINKVDAVTVNES